MEPLPLLSPVETRILGVLIEKSRTTPDVYPLTVNSLGAGCNQKTSRDPVMSLGEAEIQAVLEDLRHRALVMESYGASGRVLRYTHNFAKVYGLPAAAVDLLAVLMLRGPQTASELRANSERLHHFADASAVEAYLEELADREAGPLAVRLPRQPGAREPRWAHLLCGAPAQASTAQPAVAGQDHDLAEMADRLARLEAQVAALEAALADLRRP
jgi:hypothetical protein